MNLRIGMGYDIHRLVEGRPLFLGGIKIDFEKGLLGHSDGDAVAHALADAMLGAAGLDDIGSCFPDDDPAYKGASGVRILSETRSLLSKRGAVVSQVDLTILAEAPRLSSYRESMREALSGAIGCPAGAVSIKARTHEGLGEIGRGEAIAAYAVVLLQVAEKVGS